MQANAYIISFPIDFKLSRFRILYSHHILVTLEGDNYIGIGSGVLYRSTAWTIKRLWDGGIRHKLTSLKLDELEVVWQPWLDTIVHTAPALAFAIDTALWDLKGHITNQSVASLLGDAKRSTIPITEQIFISDWSKTENELNQILQRGTSRIKVKTGFGLQQDIDLIKRVRDCVGNGVELRVDANRAYSFDESVEMYKKLPQFDVLAVEEPLYDKDFATLRRFRETVGMPVMLDESVLTLEDLQNAITAKAIDCLNIKLTRIGGLSKALAYRKFCDNNGIAVSIGCNEDLGPGMASILHLSAATAQLYSTEGIGHLRLGSDLIKDPPSIQKGSVHLSDGNGLGVHLVPNLQKHLLRAHIFDLSASPAFAIRRFAILSRLRQRMTNVLYRLGRSIS
jgi:L-alanine-DL-glutamate epimerase-like enolase superfamily enzyme